MKRIAYLVEDFEPSLSLGGGTVVSLSPRASFLLKKTGIAYTILENYLSEKALRAAEDVFFEEELKWFGEFDRFLKEIFEECRKWDLNLASIHYNRLKYLTNSLIIKSRYLFSFLSTDKPDEVVLLAKEYKTEGDASIYNFFRYDRWGYGSLLELMWEQKKPYSFNFRKASVNPAEVPSNGQGTSLRSATRPGPEPRASTAAWADGQARGPADCGSSRMLRLHQLPAFLWSFGVRPYLQAFGLKGIYHYFYFAKWRKGFGAGDGPLDRELYLDSGVSAMDSLIRQSVSRGNKVYIKNERETALVSDLFEQVLVRNPSGVSQASREALRSSLSPESVPRRSIAFSRLESSRIADWVVERCGLDVRSIIHPYLCHFVSEICPQVIREFKIYLSFLKSRGITRVIARGSAGKNYPAVLMAAKVLGIPRVCFQHSVGPLDMKDWVMDELGFFDVNCAMSTPAKEYFTQYAKLERFRACQVQESSHYLHALKMRYERKPNRRSKVRRKSLIFYVPAKLPHGMSRFNSVVYPMTWYYEHQKVILEYFGKRKDLLFVYKHSPHQRWVEDSVFPWLSMQNFSNVSVEEKPFVRYLGEMDRVIFDYPSTGLFEASVVGIPVLALYHEAMKVWEPMFRIFGQSLQRFSHSLEAIEKIDAFLSGDAQDFRQELPCSEKEGMELLWAMDKAHGQTGRLALGPLALDADLVPKQ